MDHLGHFDSILGEDASAVGSRVALVCLDGDRFTTLAMTVVVVDDLLVDVYAGFQVSYSTLR